MINKLIGKNEWDQGSRPENLNFVVLKFYGVLLDRVFLLVTDPLHANLTNRQKPFIVTPPFHISLTFEQIIQSYNTFILSTY